MEEFQGNFYKDFYYSQGDYRDDVPDTIKEDAPEMGTGNNCC